MNTILPFSPRFEDLFEVSEVAILVCDLNRLVTHWNPFAERIYGWSPAEAIGQSLDELIYLEPASLQQAYAQVLESGQWSGPLSPVAMRGGFLSVESQWKLLADASGQAQAILICDTDVTERKKLEGQVLRSQRVESIGTLAGGVVHDLNNILTPIHLSVRLLKERASNHEDLEVLETIEACTQRGAELVQQILSFGRGADGHKMDVQLVEVVRAVQKIVQDTFPKNVHFTMTSPEESWDVVGDFTQLHQVLMNLCINARDAMTSGGKLSVDVGHIVLDEHDASMMGPTVPGPHVVLTVTDTGSGINPADFARIYERFFSTKPASSGLGLATVQAIVKGHGGFITVQSALNCGTTFKIFLPARPRAAGILPEAVIDELPRGQGELVLVVDDEAPIRAICRKTLETFGYEVITANDGIEAVTLFAIRGSEIAVVITDIMMPDMDGHALIHALRRLDPGVKVIAMSGFNPRGATSSAVDKWLAKPYNTATLLTTVRQVIDAPGRTRETAT
ncbi:MAG: response regulator [Bradymonadaceae bacterium]|nr:response regulator [Lujinxingiaceae bacterium]